jgi:hypothetical protein
MFRARFNISLSQLSRPSTDELRDKERQHDRRRGIALIGELCQDQQRQVPYEPEDNFDLNIIFDNGLYCSKIAFFVAYAERIPYRLFVITLLQPCHSSQATISLRPASKAHK